MNKVWDKRLASRNIFYNKADNILLNLCNKKESFINLILKKRLNFPKKFSKTKKLKDKSLTI